MDLSRSSFLYCFLLFMYIIYCCDVLIMRLAKRVQSMWAELSRVIRDSSTQRPLSAHLKFQSAPVKTLHACSNLKEGAIPDIAPIWPVCLLYIPIFYKLHLSANDLWCRLTLEGTRESGLVHALDLWRTVSERNWSKTETSLWPLD